MSNSSTAIARRLPALGRAREQDARSAWIAMGSCAAACVLVGTSFSVAHLLSTYPYTTGQALRYALAALVLAVLVRAREQGARHRLADIGPRGWLRVAALAGAGAVGFNLAILAAERTSEPAVPGVVVGCSPLVIAVLIPALARRRPSPRLAGAALLVVAGAAVVQGLGHTDPAGLGFSVIALAGEVSFSLLAVPLLKTISPLILSTCVCAAAAVEAAVVSLATGGVGAWRLPDPAQAGAIAWQALPVTVLAFCWWYSGLSRLGPERAQLFIGLMPIAAAGTGPLLGAGTLGWAQLTGSGLVGAGVVLGSLRTSRADKPT